jgi:hypothetical protein
MPMASPQMTFLEKCFIVEDDIANEQRRLESDAWIFYSMDANALPFISDRLANAGIGRIAFVVR